MQILLAILVGVIVLCSVLAISSIRANAERRKTLRERIAPDGSSYDEDAPKTSDDFGDHSLPAKSLLTLLRGFDAKIDQKVRGLDLMFARAGITSKDGPVYYIFFQRVISPVLALLGLLLIFTAHDDLLSQAIGFFLAVGAVFGPKLYLKNKIDHRAKRLQRAFPDTLDLLLICVESGLALDAALNRVCNELARAYPDMTSELNRTRLELALLNDRVRALMNLGDRTDMVAFRSLVVALIQSEKFGTSLIDTLRVLSEDFRLQRLATAEAKAARLPVLMTIPLIFLLMPAFMIIILGPAIVGVMHNGQEVTGKKNR